MAKPEKSPPGGADLLAQAMRKVFSETDSLTVAMRQDDSADKEAAAPVERKVSADRPKAP